MEKERIQKVLSSLGVCSRRKAEKMIEEGRIKVNGVVISEQGFKCTSEDFIEVDGEPVCGSAEGAKPEEKRMVYLAVNKPYDVVSTANDPQGRAIVTDLVPKSYGRVFPVGRLDHNSTGLILLTNDGEFANLITHPSSAPEKEYVVKVKNPLRGDEIDQLAKGLYVTREGYRAAPCQAKVLKSDATSVIFSIILHEGKKREIRHMMETLDHPVKFLMRIRIGNILLGRLPEGKFKEIPFSDIEELKKTCYENKASNNYSKEEIADFDDFE